MPGGQGRPRRPRASAQSFREPKTISSQLGIEARLLFDREDFRAGLAGSSDSPEQIGRAHV